MIEAHDLTKIYTIKNEKSKKKKARKSEKFAVNHLSFTAEPGKITGLIGENGAGKTTTMRILATLIQATSGTVTINGLDVVRDAQAVRQQIGVLFGGEPILYDLLTARENILYFAQLNGMDTASANAQIDILSERLGMETYIDQKVKNFSRGMKQKAAIARTVVHNPSVIIFDEPTTGLDVTSARIIYDFLEQFREMGKTILLSSHSMYEVERLCDTVVIMHQGKFCAEGKVSDLLAEYNQTRFEDLFIHLTGGMENESN